MSPVKQRQALFGLIVNQNCAPAKELYYTINTR